MSGGTRDLGERSRYLLAAAVLLVGSLLYLARPTDPVAVAWLDRIGLTLLASAVRATRQLVYLHVPLPAWLRGSVSDFSYAFAVGLVFASGSRRIIAVGFLVALGHEIAQGLGLTSGTFDVIDLAVLSGAFALALALFRPRHVAAPGRLGSIAI
ncbi:MAG TPA: hypothetical protein VLT33_15780 [Labilithrix sp.]|nr:hypothetical protein [Labilithrix sp.]